MFSRSGAWSPIRVVMKTFDFDQVEVLGDLHGSALGELPGQGPC